MTVVSCEWKSDGSVESQAAQFGENASGETTVDIEVASATVNLMAAFKEDLPSVPSYWFTVTIGQLGQNGSISVGVVTPSEFQPGYETKGMFYNGNLTNCGAALATNYGPYLKLGDRCTIEYTTSATGNTRDSCVSMTIYLNGKFIGKGFEIQNPAKKPFFPCVSVGGKVKFYAKITTEKPPDLSPPTPASQSLDGKWIIVEAKDQSGSNYLPVASRGKREKEITMNIDFTAGKDERPSLSLSAKVCNMIRTSMQYQKMLIGEETSSGIENTGKIIYQLTPPGRPPMSTRMMPFSPYDKVEREISLAMTNGWKTIKLLPDQNSFNILNVDGAIVARCVRCAHHESITLTSYLY
eukprot:jgi/Psemu1/227001/e_gw1.1931.1.1